MKLTKRSSSQKSKAAKPQEEELLYVHIENPLQLRRSLLTGSKNALDLLRKGEHLRQLRTQKEQAQAELHHTFEELIVLNKKLRSAMPKAPTPAPIPVPPPAPIVQPKKELPPLPETPPTPPPHKVKSKIELLEDELANIEHKLSALE